MLKLHNFTKLRGKKINNFLSKNIKVCPTFKTNKLTRKYLQYVNDINYLKYRKLNNFRWKNFKFLYFLRPKHKWDTWKFIARGRRHWLYAGRHHWVLQKWFQTKQKLLNKKLRLIFKRKKWWINLSRFRRRKPRPRVKWFLRDWLDAKKNPEPVSISLNTIPTGFIAGLKYNWKLLNKYKKRLFSPKNLNKYKKLKKIFQQIKLASYRRYYKLLLFNFKTKKYSFWYYKKIVKYIKKLFLQRKLNTYKNNVNKKKISYFFFIKKLLRNVINPKKKRFSWDSIRKHLIETRRKYNVKKQNTNQLLSKKIKRGNKLPSKRKNSDILFLSKSKYRKQIPQRRAQCFIPLQFYKNIDQTESNFIKNFKRFLYLCISPCDTMLSWEYTNSDFHNINVSATNNYWTQKKATRKIHSFLKRKETRKLKKIKPFFRYFGFRHSKNRNEQPMQRTKKFKKFSIFNRILRLFEHKKTITENSIFPLQSFRTRLSYYKMRWQATTYFLQNYFFKKYNRKELSTLAAKSQKKQKNKLITFTSRIEFTLIHLLLRMRFLSTAGMAHQFIKHGNIFINYKKITHPLFVVKPGDTVSIFIKTLTFHRFYDPTLMFRLCQGLYRKNTGRRSPATLEPRYSFIKSGLNNFSKLDRIDNSILHKSLVSVITKKKFLLKRPRWEKALLNPRGPLVEHSTFRTSPTYSSWKHGFIFDLINSDFFKRQHIDKLNNILI